MANFNGDVLPNSTLHISSVPQSGAGTNQSPIDVVSVSEGNASENVTVPAQVSGIQSGYGQHRLTALPASEINPIPHYKLSCEDDTGLRHNWVDTSISLTNAPDGFTYAPETFVVEGKF